MSSSVGSDVVISLQEGPLATVTVNRPKSLNALNREVLEGLSTNIAALEQAGEIRAVIVTGAGEKAFVAGADIQSMNGLNPDELADYVKLGQDTMCKLEQAPFPIIAAVNGFALGGGLELALACDLIVASRAAKLGQPEVNLGIIPGFGGTQRLLHRCGTGVARRLCYTGDIISAEEGYQLGLVDKLCEPDNLLAEAKQLAETIVAKGPLAVAGAKEVIRGAQNKELQAGLKQEVDKFLELFQTADRKEGMTAFLEKRSPEFKGN